MTVSGDWTALSGYRAGQRLAKNDEITAIFVANDRMAMGVIRALIEVGKRVPDDVSVVGFDDLPEAEFQVIPLTTMRQDYEKSAQYAVRELVQMMRGLPPSERTIDLQPELIVRQSSGVVRGG
jgi:DNA-binding LacI/PurR family transcriptional regulator